MRTSNLILSAVKRRWRRMWRMRTTAVKAVGHEEKMEEKNVEDGKNNDGVHSSSSSDDSSSSDSTSKKDNE